MQQYVDDLGKMALALTSAQMAKDEAVKEHGVGEELAVHFLAWVDDALIAICQMDAITSRMSPDDRFLRCKSLCELLRLNFWSSAITMVSEGYCSLDISKTHDMELSAAFADPSLPVYECITVSHASIDEDTGNITPVSMVAAPYKLNLGRTVEWKEVLVYPESAKEHLRQTKYPTMLRRSLQVEPEESSSEDSMEQIREQINRLGFLMQNVV